MQFTKHILLGIIRRLLHSAVFAYFRNSKYLLVHRLPDLAFGHSVAFLVGIESDKQTLSRSFIVVLCRLVNPAYLAGFKVMLPPPKFVYPQTIDRVSDLSVGRFILSLSVVFQGLLVLIRVHCRVEGSAHCVFEFRMLRPRL